MMKALRLPITATLLSFSITTFAQQPADCSDCTCTVPSMIGQTLFTSASQPACDPNQPTTYQLDASRYGRFFGEVGNKYTISVCDTTADTKIYVTTNTAATGIINCDDDGCGNADGPSALWFIPANDELYRIYVFNDSCGGEFPEGTMIDVTITCTPTPPPPNDDPCDAIGLTVDQDLSYALGTTVNASNSQAVVP